MKPTSSHVEAGSRVAGLRRAEAVGPSGQSAIRNPQSAIRRMPLAKSVAVSRAWKRVSQRRRSSVWREEDRRNKRLSALSTCVFGVIGTLGIAALLFLSSVGVFGLLHAAGTEEHVRAVSSLPLTAR